MDISSLFGSTGAALFESIFGETSKKDAPETDSPRVSSLGMDTVSISDAAKEKLAFMAVADSKEENSQNEADEGANAASGGNGGGSSKDSESKVQSLKAKLASLQTSLGRATDAEATAIQAQINEIMTEIAALESGAA